MVDLFAAGSKLKVQTAARKAIADLRIPWHPVEKHLERLRKRYPLLEKRGLLPKPSLTAAEIIRATYSQLNANVERARRELAEADQEAEALGLASDLAEHSPVILANFLKRRLAELDDITSWPVEVVATQFEGMGLDEEEAIAKYTQAVADRELYEKQIDVLERIAKLRLRTSWTPPST